MNINLRLKNFNLHWGVFIQFPFFSLTFSGLDVKNPGKIDFIYCPSYYYEK